MNIVSALSFFNWTALFKKSFATNQNTPFRQWWKYYGHFLLYEYMKFALFEVRLNLQFVFLCLMIWRLRLLFSGWCSSYEVPECTAQLFSNSRVKWRLQASTQELLYCLASPPPLPGLYLIDLNCPRKKICLIVALDPSNPTSISNCCYFFLAGQSGCLLYRPMTDNGTLPCPRHALSKAHPLFGPHFFSHRAISWTRGGEDTR